MISTREELDRLQARLMRKTFELAREALRKGHRPFGALIADEAGIIAEAGSTQVAQGDPTAHAEMNAVRAAVHKVERARLQKATIYASSEPCAMCSAAIYYSGIRQVIFGLSEGKLGPMRNVTSRGAGVRMSCRTVFARSSESVSVIGPVLEAEAEALHTGYWQNAQ